MNLPSFRVRRRAASELYEWASAVTYAMCFVVLLFTFLFRIVGVQGISMKNTLNRDAISEDQLIARVVITRLFYTPKQGDIVVLSTPAVREPIIKRVIAVQGQTVQILSGKVIVDGTALTEPYVFPGAQTLTPSGGGLAVTVPRGYVFVLGDNREHSHDSRWSDIGCVDVRKILGHAVFRIYPLSGGRFGPL